MTIGEVVTTGLLLVFALLVLITGILYLLPQILRLIGLGKKKDTPKQAAPKESPAPVQAQASSDSDESQIVAAIMAAISAYEESLGNPSGNFRVVSFKKIGRRGV